MKKYMVSAMFYIFFIVPTHAAFAGNQGHHRDPLVQLIPTPTPKSFRSV